MDPWVLLENLGLYQDGMLTSVAFFLTQIIEIQVEGLPEGLGDAIAVTDHTKTDVMWMVLHELRDDPRVGPKVVDVVARRIAKHGVPKRPIYLNRTGENQWFVSIEAVDEDRWEICEIPPDDQATLLHAMRLGGLLAFKSRKEAVVRIERTSKDHEKVGLFGDLWLPAANAYGWVFETKP